jgi:diguanylate cyclase (GGDEF)-like protein
MTIERRRRDRSDLFAVLFLDFDRFKVINDSLGHAEGDNLLKQIARRLESTLRTGDLVARLGGDEFTILVNKLSDSSAASLVAEHIQESLKIPFEIGGGELYISASIGIALSTTGHDKAGDMLRDADIAMYRAKAKGRARYQVFDQTMHEQALAHMQIESEMRQAIEQKEFLLQYQPIINLETKKLIGFEALVRWKHKTRGMIPPSEFIGVAEENGLILPLGKWILHESCRQLRCWQKRNPAALGLIMSVNLSSKQFLQFNLAEQIIETLEQTGLAARCLKLEITESHIMVNTEMAGQTISSLRAAGVELSIDDFGTGYSSLSYLHRLPVSYLKIDHSFITRMIENEENSEIVRTIIKLGQNLKMKVIAEGIETNEQVVQLKKLNCEYGQGYVFAEPLEARASETFIARSLGTSRRFH